MRTILRIVMVCLPLVCLLVPAGVSLAQEKPATPAPENPLSAWNKKADARVKDILLRSAQKMPEENYSFKPTDAVRSSARSLDTWRTPSTCSVRSRSGRRIPRRTSSTPKTSKADLIAA